MKAILYDTKLSPSIIMKQSAPSKFAADLFGPQHKLTQQYAALYQEIESR